MSVALALILAQAEPSLPDFSLREHNPRGQYNFEQLRQSGLDCEYSDGGRRATCSQIATIAGFTAAISFSMLDRKLTRLGVAGPRDAIPQLLAELKTKYGMPCREAKETVTNGYGNSIPSQTFTWCFSTGELRFSERYGRIDQYGLEYRDRVNSGRPERVEPSF